MLQRLFAILLLTLIIHSTGAAEVPERLLMADNRQLVARADLTYTEPVIRSEEGMPVGNGRMGTLVWTTPDVLKFQLNRVDVFSVGHDTRALVRAGSDYASGCGIVDVRFEAFGQDVFVEPHYRQHLRVYDGTVAVEGDGVAASVTTWQEGDVLAVDVTDRRPQPGPVSVDLRKLRYASQWMDGRNWELTRRNESVVLTGPHSASSRLDIRDGHIVLTQQFREGAYYNASATAIGIVGRASEARYYSETTVRLTAAPGQGTFTIFMATAASFDPDEDVAAKALAQLEAAMARGSQGLRDDNERWWSRFWSRGLVSLQSADGEADLVERNYTYFLYLMASASRGQYMPHFNGLVWYTNGDVRQWGSQYWGHNQGSYYNGLTPANRPELIEPVFSTYARHFDAYARAARQQWGSQGVWIPETSWFNGPEALPDAIADELQDLVLARKPWDQRSDQFRRFATNRHTFNSRWNWISHWGTRYVDGHFTAGDRGHGPFGYVTHIFCNTAKIAYLHWLHYEYHLDIEHLRTTGYPLIKGAVEFYRNHPNVRRGDDGRYHIHHTSNMESDWNSSNTIAEVAAMHALTPIAIRASQILDVDASLRPLWQEFHENLVPLPDGLTPATYYDLVTVARDDEHLERLRQAFTRKPVGPDTRLHVLSRDAVAAANLGLADYVQYMIPGQIRTTREACDPQGIGESGLGVLRNRMGLREGPGCLEAQRLGNAANALHAALLQCAPPLPGGPSVLRVFPAWPRQWDAQFTLAARGALRVSSAIRNGDIAFVQIEARDAGEVRLVNPWPGQTLTLYRNAVPAEDFAGEQLSFPAAQGEFIIVVPHGVTPVAQPVR